MADENKPEQPTAPVAPAAAAPAAAHAAKPAAPPADAAVVVFPDKSGIGAGGGFGTAGFAA